jgi:hypothetical protein
MYASMINVYNLVRRGPLDRVGGAAALMDDSLQHPLYHCCRHTKFLDWLLRVRLRYGVSGGGWGSEDGDVLVDISLGATTIGGTLAYRIALSYDLTLKVTGQWA